MVTLGERIKETIDMSEHFIGRLSPIRRTLMLLDIMWEKLVHGANKIDYFQYGFYGLRRIEREKYISFGKLRWIHKNCNDPQKSLIFRDKVEFDKVFHDFIGREFLDMRTASFDDFKSFSLRHEELFVKPIDGTYGKGAHKETCIPDENLIDKYKKLKKNGSIIEEVVKQHPEMAEFNETSLNSMRVVTLLCADGTPEILAGSIIRIGRKGHIADNFHHYGIGAQIDNETGIVTTQGIDRDSVRYVVHPDSGKPIVGFKVPMWDKVCDTVKRAAMVVPEVRYVGWDVAVTNDCRVILIEGNDRADPDLGQRSDGIGKWQVFKPLVEEIIKEKSINGGNK